MSSSQRETPGQLTVLVTGASSGIGREVALKFASRGARIGLVARREHLLKKVAQEIEDLGGVPCVIVADVAERAQVEAAVRSLAEKWGRLDVLINNAGYVVYGSAEECPVEDFERQMKVNFLGSVYATKAALPLMRQQKAGSIINVCSINGSIHFPFNATYNASKAALRAFTLTLRQELRGSNISVSLVSPGYTETEILEVMVQRGPGRRQVLFKPLTASGVADVIVSCVERPRREFVMPFPARLLALADAIAPPVARWFLASMNGASSAKAALRGTHRSTSEFTDPHV